MAINRFSSRTHRLDQSVLLRHLEGARSYKRIAGYFTSSLFEVAGELLVHIPDVKIVCNIDIHPEDLKIAKLREARMLGRWNDRALEADALLKRDRYRRLDQFLARHGQAVRVAPDDVCGFLHGKAGVIERSDGKKLGFIGSMNETSSGWQRHYEILWEDSSPEGVAWIEEEFEFLWGVAKQLPDAVTKEVRRRGHRREIHFEDIAEPEEIAPAALVESPLYREGLSLQPWQQGFLAECMRHYSNHGCVRILLADEVGLGKTLSLGVAALTLCLLQDRDSQRQKPVLILAPATLCEQWQTEMIDKLGIPCARWMTQRKVWYDHQDRVVSPVGPEQIAQCPLRIGIVSTGLMMRDSPEKHRLLNRNFGVVILDEAHKARSRQGIGPDAGSANELLSFALELAARSDHVLLGTATPIQTRIEDLWDLMHILHQGRGCFVLGNDHAKWHQPKEVLPLISGQRGVPSVDAGWDLLRSPLPVVGSTDNQKSRQLFSAIRQDLQFDDRQADCAAPITQLHQETREILWENLDLEVSGATFFQRENPFTRHIVLRKRTILEDAGLLDRIGVDLHPDRECIRELRRFDALFEGRALRTSDDFREAYREARAFGRALSKRGRGSGFMKNLMEQRICSSIAAGLKTARRLLEGRAVEDESEDLPVVQTDNTEEKAILNRLVDRLKSIGGDPKLEATLHFLDHEHWREHGVIIFSQYFDTAEWIASALAVRYPDQPVGLYAGASRSALFQLGDRVGTEREVLKKMVAERQVRIMVATDAACEGLNLQTLGTLINIDLPWNPTRLEQRIGRIKRFGQTRDRVDMLNLVNEQTVDEKVYDRLSERMRDRFDLFGSLPDTIKDDWIEDIEALGNKMDEYVDARCDATGFDLRYTATMQPQGQDWRTCAEVLSRRDLATLMRKGWS